MTPAELYRRNRPEYFSDSETIYKVVLPKEHLAFELDKLSTNQKQDEFESFVRRILEKFVAPNLIPQVGPTGGGDGKTDLDTHPVSTEISERWYVRQEGWKPGENWAFAISTKKEWLAKCRSDVLKIISTNRGYTQIFFITNQKPSSKKKKDLQDVLSTEHDIPVIILDAEWLLNKVYENDLVELAVDTLNLSTAYKESRVSIGARDKGRATRLSELERNISSTTRYSENDFQMAEDTLEIAVLSRMLEKPKEEVLGRFDTALRFALKVKGIKLIKRVRYQRAWTLLNWYNDYENFLSEFREFRSLINSEATSSEIENYINLLFLVRGLLLQEEAKPFYKLFDFKKEKGVAKTIFKEIQDSKVRPCAALTANVHMEFLDLIDNISTYSAAKENLDNIKMMFIEGLKYVDFPFVSFKNMALYIGNIVPENDIFESLVDELIKLSSERESELAAAAILQERGYQKLIAKKYKDSIVYIGRSVVKLAKEETKKEQYLSLRMLSDAYLSFGLPWAALSAHVAASELLFRDWCNTGKVEPRLVRSVRALAELELKLGRICNFLAWNQLANILSRQVEVFENEKEIPFALLVDSCLSVRIINTRNNIEGLEDTPDIFSANDLGFSENAALFKLGYAQDILPDYSKIGITTVEGISHYFEKVKNQPFFDQMVFPTEFGISSKQTYTSNLLGCMISIQFDNIEPLHVVAETTLAFLESFFSTSGGLVFPNTQSITIIIKDVQEIETFRIEPTTAHGIYNLLVHSKSFNNMSHKTLWDGLISFVSMTIDHHFSINNVEVYLEKLFKTEEMNERISLVLFHGKFHKNIFGDAYWYQLKSWVPAGLNKNFKRLISEDPMPPRTEKYKKREPYDEKKTMENVSHSNQKIVSVIDVSLWDKAGWEGFGYFGNDQFFGVLLVFTHREIALAIFEAWRTRFGTVDKNEDIRLVIIRGIDRNHPNWYRVVISSKIPNEAKNKNTFFMITSRIHLIQPENSKNLDLILQQYAKFGCYTLCPSVATSLEEFLPMPKSGLIKSQLIFRWAWEIGEDDIDSVGVLVDDQPIIPKDIKDAPVMALLAKKKNSR